MKRQKRIVGDVVEIPLGSDEYAFARVLEEPLMAFYDYRCIGSRPPVSDIVSKPVAFKIWVMNRAVTSGGWPVIGHVPLDVIQKEKPWFLKKTRYQGRYSRCKLVIIRSLQAKKNANGLKLPQCGLIAMSLIGFVIGLQGGQTNGLSR